MATGDQTDFLARIKSTLPLRWFADVTPILDALILGLSQAWANVYSLFQYAKLQTRIKTATDGWLDVIAGDFFGSRIVRKSNQTDASFKALIVSNLFRERATRAGLIRVLTDLTGRAPTIIEPQRPADCGAYGAAVAVTRASTATYLGPNGLIQTAGVNVPRYQSGALLLEASTTNWASSSTYAIALWSAPLGGVTFSSGIDAPDGSNAAVRCTMAGTLPAGALIRVASGSTIPSGSFTGSFWCRLVSGTPGTLDSDISDYVPASGETHYTPQLGAWVRVTGVPYSGSGGSLWIDVSNFLVANVVIDFWGVQIETGTSTTSYVPTSGAGAAVRAADTLLNNMTTGSAGAGGYGVSGYYGSNLLPSQCFVIAYRPASTGIPNIAGYANSPSAYGIASQGGEYASLSMIQGQVSDADIYAAIDSVKPVGTVIWATLQS